MDVLRNIVTNDACYMQHVTICNLQILYLPLYSTQRSSKNEIGSRSPSSMSTALLLFPRQIKILIVFWLTRSVLVSFWNSVKRIFFTYDEFKHLRTRNCCLCYAELGMSEVRIISSRLYELVWEPLIHDFDILQSNCLVKWFLVFLNRISGSNEKTYFESSNPFSKKL